MAAMMGPREQRLLGLVGRLDVELRVELAAQSLETDCWLCCEASVCALVDGVGHYGDVVVFQGNVVGMRVLQQLPVFVPAATGVKTETVQRDIVTPWSAKSQRFALDDQLVFGPRGVGVGATPLRAQAGQINNRSKHPGGDRGDERSEEDQTAALNGLYEIFQTKQLKRMFPRIQYSWSSKWISPVGGKKA
ncbi:hypothetical protein INR49_022188 [Caranx melampygus]|nr:hypothetical protein INR49_022188 [Caranx melampygus]